MFNRSRRTFILHLYADEIVIVISMRDCDWLSCVDSAHDDSIAFNPSITESIMRDIMAFRI